MGNIRATATRIAGTFLLSAALFGCDTTNPIVAPDALDENRVTRADKIAGYQGTSQMLGRSPAVSPLSYDVNQIPFQPGPTNLANLGPVCDDCVMNDVPIGFDFTFYGNTYSTLQISSNGFLRFNPPNNDSGCCSGRPIPVNDTWNNIIAFAWTDLIPQGVDGGRLRYETRGTAPNRQFILHADSVRYFGGTQPNLIQWVVLHEGTNAIEIHTQLMTSRVITQGIENATGTEAHFVPGRVATTFSLVNDGVRFTPQQQQPPPTEVDIHDVYSGDPRRPSNTIHTDDQWVYVEILNIEQYLPRSASPSQVRIGMEWEDGTPAESFQILDINNDGNRDIRLRFSLQALVTDGNLTCQTTEIHVWGQDGDDRFHGVQQVTVICPTPPPPPPGTSCNFNNAARFAGAIGVGLITHPNGGTGPIAGQHVSMSDPVNNTAGSNVLLQPGGPHFRLADDFPAPANGCVMNQVITHAYRTGGAPDWTSANINIRSGSVTGPIVASTTTTTWEFTGIYRTFSGVLNDANRPVYRIIFNFANTTLPAGTYWIDWQVAGGVSAWGPYITLPPSPPGGINTQTVFENGQQMTVGGVWQPTLAPPGAELPFLVRGPDSPPLSGRQAVPVPAQPGRLPAGYGSQAEDRGQ